LRQQEQRFFGSWEQGSNQSQWHLQIIVAFALAALPLSRMVAMNEPPVVKNAQDHTTIEDADASAISISHLPTRNS
jgi:hypothetical protein